MVRITVLVAVLSIVSAAPDAAQAQCETNEDCQEGMVCEGGLCTTPPPEFAKPQPGCTRDLDCKGDRICEDGKCVSPPPAPAPQPVAPQPAPPPPAPVYAYPPQQPVEPVERGPIEWFKKGYAEANLSVVFHAWGRWWMENDNWDGEMEDQELETEAWPGFRLAGYGAPTENFHIGGYYAIKGGDGDAQWDAADESGDAKANSLGLTLRLGGRVAERVWLGASADLGIYLLRLDYDDSEILVGVEAYPRFVVDIMLIDNGSVRFGLVAALGVVTAPFIKGKALDDNDDLYVRGWYAGPMMTIGLMIGA